MWIQIFCTAPNGYREPSAAKRIDEHLTSQTASAFVCNMGGLPVKNDAGEYEVRVFMPIQHGLVESILTRHYGLHVTRTVENEN